MRTFGPCHQRSSTLLSCVLLLAVLALSGCGTLDGKLQNVLTISLVGDRAFATSLYGPIGITSELRAEDAAELRRLRGLAAAKPASAP